jgi:TPR repeat protein
VHIFLVGLVVQYFFHVTLVTLAAASMLLLLNLAYTAVTGIYWFLDAGIPIAVFLGLHLLVTDPATSPRNNYGRAIFGALYGAGVFVLYALLEWAGEPRFYDKLLFVPVLNLLVPVIDGYARRSSLARVAPFSMIAAQTPHRQNLIFMAIWIALFTAMYTTHFLGRGHPGGQTAFWEMACAENHHNACTNLRAILWDNCGDGSVAECVALGDMVERSGTPPEDVLLGVFAIARACDLFNRESCERLGQTMQGGGASGIEAQCNSRNAQACYILGTVHLMGLGASPDRATGFRFFNKSCDLNLPTGCGVVAESYLYGVGTVHDMARAVSAYEKACAGAYAPACMKLAQLLVTGDGVPPNERRGLALFGRACRLGLTDACAVR